MAKKTYVLDTSALITDTDCMNSYDNNDILIPIKVLEDIEGIRNILTLSKNSGVKRFFFSSSSEVYGEPVEFPQNAQPQKIGLKANDPLHDEEKTQHQGSRIALKQSRQMDHIPDFHICFG